MSNNQLSTQIDQLGQLSNTIFESITDGKTSNIDDTERLRLIIKELTSVYDEAKNYHGTNIGDNQLSYDGINYKIIKTIGSSESTSCNPNKIFEKLKEVKPTALEDFIKLISITKSKFNSFAKDNNLQSKIFDSCMDTVQVKPSIRYDIKPIK